MATQTLEKNHTTATHLGPKADLGIKDPAGCATLLNSTLADLYVLSIKTKQFHWNVISVSFKEIHLHLDEQYEKLDEAIDLVAERVRKIGYAAIGSLAEFQAFARLKEHPSTEHISDRDMLHALLQDHEAVIRQLRKDIATTADDHDDAGTSDMLTGLIREHEEMAWMLRAYFEK